MRLDDALQIIRPDRDSQYKLLPCRHCGADNAAYVEYKHQDGPRWRVQCFTCGYILERPGELSRHDLQMEWNGVKNERRKKHDFHA